MDWKKFDSNDIPIGYFSFDFHGCMRINDMNETLFSELGYTSFEEFKTQFGECAINIIHPDDMNKLEHIVDELKESDAEKIIRKRIFIKIRNNRLKFNYYITNAVVQKIDDGVVCSLFLLDIAGDVEAIEEDKKRIEQLTQLNKEGNMIINGVPAGVHRCKLWGDFRVTYVSDGLCQMTGYTKEDIFERFAGKYYELIVEDDRHIFVDAITELAKYPHTRSMQYRMKLKSGGYIWVVDTTKTVRNENGDMVAYGIVMSVMRNLLTMKDDLSNISIQALMESLLTVGVMIMRRDIRRQPIYVSESMDEITGYEKGNFVAVWKDKYRELIHPDDYDSVLLSADMIGRERIPEGELKFRIVKANGDTAVLRCNYRHIIYDGEDAYLNIFKDISADEGVLMCEAGKNAVLKETTRQDTSEEKNIFIRTFGHFDVFVNEHAIAFRHKNTKELLALLVDRRGGYVTNAEIISALWEEESVTSTTQARVRTTFKRLKDTLREYGIEDIVESRNGDRRIRTDKVKCDLYEYLTGEERYKKLFRGDYMMDYSWSEYTLANLLY